MRDLATKRFGSSVGALVEDERKKRGQRPNWSYADRPPRRAVLVASFGRHAQVKLQIDPRAEGVEAPSRLRDEARISLTLTEATPNLVMGPDRLSFTLDDEGAPFAWVVPWPAVRAISVVGAEDRGFTWEPA